MITLQSLKNNSGARRASKRVGRGTGSGLGKTCGAGHKGQMARKGHKRKRGFEGGQMPLLRRLPKRGFKNVNRRSFLPVNVADLERFADGEQVDPGALKRAGLADGSADGVKVLGNGELTRRLTVRAHAFSVGARAKIEAAGGVCEIL